MPTKRKLQPSLEDTIKAAIRHLSNPNGSNLAEIKRYLSSICQTAGEMPDSLSIRQCIENSVDRGDLLKVSRGRYTISEIASHEVAIKAAIRHLNNPNGSTSTEIKRYFSSVSQTAGAMPDSLTIRQCIQSSVERGDLLKKSRGRYAINGTARRKKSKDRNSTKTKPKDRSSSKKSSSQTRKRKRSSSTKRSERSKTVDKQLVNKKKRSMSSPQAEKKNIPPTQKQAPVAKNMAKGRNTLTEILPALANLSAYKIESDYENLDMKHCSYFS